MAGSDDRSVRLWDLNTSHCQHVLLTHTCADIRFDTHKVVTASFDNTIGMWEWTTGRRLQCYQGHTGAGELAYDRFITMVYGIRNQCIFLGSGNSFRIRITATEIRIIRK